MKTTAPLREYLSAHHVELIEEKTTKAIKIFNRLFQEGRNIAAEYHITC